MQGEDKFGRFKIEPGECGVCGKFSIRVSYKDTPKVTGYVRKARSFLLKHKKRGLIRKVGINCGCYAKVHRQIVHIEEGK